MTIFVYFSIYSLTRGDDWWTSVRGCSSMGDVGDVGFSVGTSRSLCFPVLRWSRDGTEKPGETMDKIDKYWSWYLILDFGLCFMCVWNKSVWFKGKTRRKLMFFSTQASVSWVIGMYHQSSLENQWNSNNDWLGLNEHVGSWPVPPSTVWIAIIMIVWGGFFQILPSNSQTNRWESKKLWEWPQPLSLSLLASAHN